jgi:hypothetical protein
MLLIKIILVVFSYGVNMYIVPYIKNISKLIFLIFIYMIIIANKRSKAENLRKKYGEDAVIVDVTSKATDDMVRLSPFYPHGGIPVPFSPGFAAMSVEGIWQGLKVFENCGIDVAMFYNATMKNIKRTVRRFGRPLGHKKGVQGSELLSYIDARMQIYVPTYKWVLENKAQKMLKDGVSKEDIAAYTIEFVRRTLAKMSENLRAKYLNIPILYAGGVMSCSLIKKDFEKRFDGYFAEPMYSSDNAAGTALLCYRKIMSEALV